MFYVDQVWRIGSEPIPYSLAILLEQAAGRFGLFIEAQRLGAAPPSAATVAAWLKLPVAGDQSRIEAATALQLYLNTLTLKITSSSGRLEIRPALAEACRQVVLEGESDV